MRNLIIIIATVLLSGTVNAQVEGLERYKHAKDVDKDIKVNKRRFIILDGDTTWMYISNNDLDGVYNVLKEARRVLSLNGIALDLDTSHILSYTNQGFEVDINKTYDLSDGRTARVYIISGDNDVIFGIF